VRVPTRAQVRSHRAPPSKMLRAFDIAWRSTAAAALIFAFTAFMAGSPYLLRTLYDYLGGH